MKKKIAEHYKHIDNGGVIIEIWEDEGEEGFKSHYLHMQAGYFGYPTIKTEMDITLLGPEWLKQIAEGSCQGSQVVKAIVCKTIG